MEAASEPARKQQDRRLSQVIVGLGKLLPGGGATDPIPASLILPGEIPGFSNTPTFIEHLRCASHLASVTPLSLQYHPIHR